MATDLREKAFAYKQVRSVRSYLIVHQDEPAVEHHYRLDGDIWSMARLESTGTLSIPCGDIELDLSAIYEDVEFSD